MSDNWIVRTNDFKESALGSPVKRCERSELLKKALKSLLLLWGIAVLCLLIPVLHFFLVPAFLVLGIIFGYRAFGFKYRIENATCSCPACLKEIIFKDLWFREVARSSCVHCGVQLVVMRKV